MSTRVYSFLAAAAFATVAPVVPGLAHAADPRRPAQTRAIDRAVALTREAYNERDPRVSRPAPAREPRQEGAWWVTERGM